jgi:dynein heavy chain
LQINTAKGILDTILSVQPKESVGGKAGDTREAIVHRMADDMLRKLPRDYVPHEVTTTETIFSSPEQIS